MVGVNATLLMDTLSRGMIVQMVDNQIRSHISHIQIHRKGFRDNPVIQATIPDAKRVNEALKNVEGIAFSSPRVLTYGLVSSAANSSGILLVGIDPDREANITSVSKSLQAGRYLSGNPNEAVVGAALAEKLGVGLGDRIVAMASAIDGHVGSDVYRIVGLFETFSSEFDKSTIYVPIASAQSMLAIGEEVSEYVLIVSNMEQLPGIQKTLEERLGDKYEVHSYAQILPILLAIVDMYDQSMAIFYGIIGIALIFGIINTMLMSVFERIHEFGVLKAIGMPDHRLLLMVLLEALHLGIIGTAAGFAIGYILYIPLSHTGIDLRMFSEGLRSFGVGAIIYPVLTWGSVAMALLIIPFISVLGALYPALKAVRLTPVSAIRHV
jgi:ABC-type lipoprotein release transport system permease subunit